MAETKGAAHSDECEKADGGICLCACGGSRHGVRLRSGKLRNMGAVKVTKARIGGKEVARVVDEKTGRPPGGGTKKERAAAPEKPASKPDTKPAEKPASGTTGKPKDGKFTKGDRVTWKEGYVRYTGEVEDTSANLYGGKANYSHTVRIESAEFVDGTPDYIRKSHGDLAKSNGKRTVKQVNFLDAAPEKPATGNDRAAKLKAEQDARIKAATKERMDAEKRKTDEMRAKLAGKPAEKPAGAGGGALADMSPEDQQRIRNAVADRGPGIYASPMVGGSKSDVGRYLAEGELGKQLADRHDWRKVWQAVSQVIDEDPEALKRSPAKVKADTEARTAKADEIAGRANAAVKAGDMARAADLLDEAAAIDPDHVAFGRRLAEVRDLIRKRANDKPASKPDAKPAEKPSTGGSRGGAVETTIDGKETAYVPGKRSTIGLPERPQVGRDKPAGQQLGLFADLAAEKRTQLAGQGTLLDAFNKVPNKGRSTKPAKPAGKPADPEDGLPPRLTAEEAAAAIGTPVRAADGTMVGVVRERPDGKFDAHRGDADAVAKHRATIYMGFPTRAAAEAQLRQRAIADRLEAEERAKLPFRRVVKSGSTWAIVSRDDQMLRTFRTKREAEEYATAANNGAGSGSGGAKPAEKPASKPKAPGGYEVGQRVEVLTTNFDKPGFPEEWMAGEVAEINPRGDGGHVDIGVRLSGKKDKNGEPLWHREVVGPRGGNKRIRGAADQGKPTGDRGKPAPDSRDRPDRDRRGAGPDGLVRGRPVEQLKAGDRVVGRTEGAAFRPIKGGEPPEVASLSRGADDIGKWVRVNFTDGTSERFYEGEHVTIRPSDGGVARSIARQRQDAGLADPPARVQIPARFDDLPPMERMRERLRHVEANTKTDVDKVTAAGRERARAEFNIPSDEELDRLHRNRATNADGFRALNMKSILRNAGEIEVERSRISRLEQQRAVMQDALDRGGLSPAVADNMRKMINPGGRLGNSLEEARGRLRNAESNQATSIQRLREGQAGGGQPVGEHAARITAKEQELERATEALNAEGARPAGTSSMRGKQHGQRIDAQIKRLAEHSATVQKLTRELEALRRDSQQPARVAKTITAETLKGARLIKDRYGWYEVEKVNRTTVKYKGPRGMDNLMKISKIVDYK